MFLKYKQTQPTCAKNEHAIDYIQTRFQVVENIGIKHHADIATRHSFRLFFLLLYNKIYTLATIVIIT